MSWSYTVMEIVDVVMRIPPLFVLDSVLNQTFLVSLTTEHGVPYLVWLCLAWTCFICAFVFFLLPIKVLLEVYSVGLSTTVLWFSHFFNSHYINVVTSSETATDSSSDAVLINPERIVINALVQIALAFSYNIFRLELPATVSGNVKCFMERFRMATYICMQVPIICSALEIPAPYLHRITSIYALIIALELKLTLLMRCKSAIIWVKLTYLTTKTFIRTRGFQAGIQIFLEVHWVRLHVPTVLRVFWITRLASKITRTVVEKWYSTQIDTSPQDVFTLFSSLEIAQELLVSGCETIVALMGMTSVISSVTNYIGMMMASFVGSDTDEDKNMGTISAILFFILALQTGLTGLDPEKRYVRLGRNFCLLSAAILHFCHGIVSPILMNLSASQNPSVWKHSRPLAMCAFLVVFPSCFLHYLWSNHNISTWLLAVSAFNIEVIVKVMISLLLYIVFMVDAYAEVFWESLDDYVYYIKSTGNTIEFLFGIFVFCNGAWIMVFESGGIIRACMMCIHAYFNIFAQARNGWKVFIKRRTAVNKIKSLPQASSVQIESHNDVCAICYQDLQAARVTNCNHLFHSVCLRKWLYVQDNCPLCHELIYIPEPDPNIENRNNAEFEQNMNDANMENLANAMNYRAGLQREGVQPNRQEPVAQNNGIVAHAHQE